MIDDLTPTPTRPDRTIRLQAARELGIARVAALAVYRLGLRSGHYRRVLTAGAAERLAAAISSPVFRPVWRFPTPGDLDALLGPAGKERALAQAEPPVAGQVCLFGALRLPLQLAPPAPLQDWTAYEGGIPGAGAQDEPGDIKFIWEPARFGWVYALGRAYLLDGDERYPQTFWQHAEAFLDANPAYMGPHWASAQEVALRLIAFSFALQIFQHSPASTPLRVLRLLQSVAVHAGRIPPTLPYAHAQENNHRLSEAAGMATAAALLPNHPQASRWRKLGWKEFQNGLRAQIADDGAYTQHSANYHRLMLQLAVWMASLTRIGEPALEDDVVQRLGAATRWLRALVDRHSGRVPNLGPNDGAYVFPLSVLPFEDYRPVVQAAGQAFLGELSFAPGEWDELPAWFMPASAELFTAQPVDVRSGVNSDRRTGAPSPLVLHAADGRSWAYLRAARFAGRPGHADQLHLDLWRDGLNVALDPGTFSYNAAPPWDNPLTGSAVHNTLTVDGLEQMQRVGRFLYARLAQAEGGVEDAASPPGPAQICARHNGYRRLGLTHRRQVRSFSDGDWEVVDALVGSGWRGRSGAADGLRRVTLQWLLPDWPWQVEVGPHEHLKRVFLQSPRWRLSLSMQVEAPGSASQPRVVSGNGTGPGSVTFQIVRAGELIHGSGAVEPTWGWMSPTYGVKLPALALRFTCATAVEPRLVTHFHFE